MYYNVTVRSAVNDYITQWGCTPVPGKLLGDEPVFVCLLAFTCNQSETHARYRVNFFSFSLSSFCIYVYASDFVELINI